MKSGVRSGKQSSIKRKGLFDHIRQVTAVQNPDYWEEISEEDKKSWSNYMTHRFLSMKMEWIELVNELQKYNIKPKELYKIYTNILPKQKQWLKYIKRRNQMEYPDWLINIVRNYYEQSRNEAIQSIELFFLTDGGMLELRELCQRYGIEDKKINSVPGLNQN